MRLGELGRLTVASVVGGVFAFFLYTLGVPAYVAIAVASAVVFVVYLKSIRGRS